MSVLRLDQKARDTALRPDPNEPTTNSWVPIMYADLEARGCKPVENVIIDRTRNNATQTGAQKHALSRQQIQTREKNLRNTRSPGA
jgi:hypothetical protein